MTYSPNTHPSNSPVRKGCLEVLHDRGYVCRDVKPSAFVRREGGDGMELMLAELGVARSLK